MGLEQDYVPLSLQAVGSYLVSQGDEVYIKNMEIGDSVVYEGYGERQNNFDKYLKGINSLDNEIWKELRETIKNINPDKIGITVLNVKYKSALCVIDIAKEFNIPVFVGGPHPTMKYNIYPNDVEVFRGEIESEGKRILNLDNVPFPNYDVLLDKYSPNGYAHILSSRGCSYGCRFCGSSTMWGRKVTFKSPDRMLKEMRYIENRFKSDYFTFWDETFTVNKKRLYEFCSKYDLKSHWRCDTRADVINDEMVKMMKSSGCGQMSIGIESGVDKILNYINKGETTKSFIKAADILNKNNIQWKAYCIVGFPEETEGDILTTIRFIKGLLPFRITLSFFTPYEGTDLYKELYNDGIIDDNYDETFFAHQSPNNYFTKKITKERFNYLKNYISKEVDEYNKKNLEVWK
jgi:radical SAM superfamily enzyme YgiQ (UPF0313 family)